MKKIEDIKEFEDIDTYYGIMNIVEEVFQDRVEVHKHLVTANKEIKRLNNIINEVYEYLDKKKDVPEWWDTDFMICMNILKGGTGNLKDILGSDKE